MASFSLLTARSLLFVGLATFAGYAHAATTTFKYTGAEQSYVVPPGVTSLAVTVQGAPGGSGEQLAASYPYTGGRGALVTAVIPVTPGEVLAVYVGGTPLPTIYLPDVINRSTGGFNGGGPSGWRFYSFDSGVTVGGGGGASDIRQGGSTLAHRIVVAGGGGGGGRRGKYAFGGYGGDAGITGSPGDSRSTSGGGQGASQTEGGFPGINQSVAGGFREVLPTAGSLGQGGGGGMGAVAEDKPLGSLAGGGGGGGLFGGGGGGGVALGLTASNGGGGGSSYVFPAAAHVMIANSRELAKVTISTNTSVSTEEELRQAILADASVDTVAILADITLTQGLPRVDKKLLVLGGGHVLDGAGLYGLFFSQSDTLTIQDLKMTRGNAVAGNGGTAGLIAGTFTLSDGANLRFQRSDDIIFDGAIAGDGSVTQSGSGDLTFTGTNTFTGDLTIDFGTVTISGVLHYPTFVPASLAADIVNHGKLIFSQQSLTGGRTYSFGGKISGPGSVSIEGRVQLTGANTYSGGTKFLSGSSVTPADLTSSFLPPFLFEGGEISWLGADTWDVSLLDLKIPWGRLNTAGSVRFANPIAGGPDGMILKYGEGTLTLAASPAYEGSVEIRSGTLQLEPGGTLAPGAVVLASTGTSFFTTKNNTVGSLEWESTASLRLPIGAGSTPLAVIGGLTRDSSSATPCIELIDKGAVPGQTYTLATFDSTNLTASQFLVTGLLGTLTVEPHALKFTVAPEPPDPTALGVAVSVAKHKNRAVYAVRNTGDVSTVFRLRAATRITNATGGTKFSGRRVAIAVTYHRDGKNITSAMKARTATVTLAPGGTARITAQLHVRGGNAPVAQRFVTCKLIAQVRADASISDSAETRILVVPNPR